MMTTSTAQRRGSLHFELVPMRAALGAEVRGLDLKEINDATFDAIHECWLEHLLLVFRGQKMVAEDLVKLVRRFGTPVTSSGLHQARLEERTANQLFNLPPEVTVVTGTIVRAWKLVADEIKAAAESRMCQGYPSVNIMASTLGPYPTLMGAFSLVLADKFASVSIT